MLLLEFVLVALAGVLGGSLVELQAALAGRDGDLAVAGRLVPRRFVGVLVAPFLLGEGLQAGDQGALMVVIEFKVVRAWSGQKCCIMR